MLVKIALWGRGKKVKSGAGERRKGPRRIIQQHKGVDRSRSYKKGGEILRIPLLFFWVSEGPAEET